MPEHDFIGPHMTLEGKTLAEIAGFGIEGHSKWKQVLVTVLRTMES